MRFWVKKILLSLIVIICIVFITTYSQKSIAQSFPSDPTTYTNDSPLPPANTPNALRSSPHSGDPYDDPSGTHMTSIQTWCQAGKVFAHFTWEKRTDNPASYYFIYNNVWLKVINGQTEITIPDINSGGWGQNTTTTIKVAGRPVGLTNSGDGYGTPYASFTSASCNGTGQSGKDADCSKGQTCTTGLTCTPVDSTTQATGMACEPAGWCSTTSVGQQCPTGKMCLNNNTCTTSLNIISVDPFCGASGSELLVSWDKAPNLPAGTSYKLTYEGRTGVITDPSESLTVLDNSVNCTGYHDPNNGLPSCKAEIPNWKPGASLTYLDIALGNSKTIYDVANNPVSGPTNCPVPSPTPVPSGQPIAASIAFTIHLYGIDNNQTTTANQSSRPFTFLFFPAGADPNKDTPIKTINANLNYNSATGYFDKPAVKIDSIPSGSYDIYAKTPVSLLGEMASGFSIDGSKPVFSIPDPSTISNGIAPILMGDINGDGSINILDYQILRSCYGEKNNGSQVSSNCLIAITTSKSILKDDQIGIYPDINNDGVVDGVDYNILVRNFGKGNINSIQQTQPTPTSVPTIIPTVNPT